jgi:DNA repair photolyase
MNPKYKKAMKLIYKPKPGSPAAEYAKYAASYSEGCSDTPCHYCYMAKMAKRFGRYFDPARIKPELAGMNIRGLFESELLKNLPEYQKHGIFFIFNGDPCAPGIIDTSQALWKSCVTLYVPVIVLTKQAGWVDDYISRGWKDRTKEFMNFGFTLTGHDVLEPGCAKNDERIKVMRELHDEGFKTWISAEPVLDFASSLRMIKQSFNYCNHFKIGLRSGWHPDKKETLEFISEVNAIIPDETTIYWKNSILKEAGMPLNKAI